MFAQNPHNGINKTANLFITFEISKIKFLNSFGG